MVDGQSGEFEPVYLTLADVLELHALIIGASAAEAADQLRNRAGLESAIAGDRRRPFRLFLRAFAGLLVAKRWQRAPLPPWDSSNVTTVAARPTTPTAKAVRGWSSILATALPSGPHQSWVRSSFPSAMGRQSRDAARTRFCWRIGVVVERRAMAPVASGVLSGYLLESFYNDARDGVAVRRAGHQGVAAQATVTTAPRSHGLQRPMQPFDCRDRLLFKMPCI
jgi:hypothetical protein